MQEDCGSKGVLGYTLRQHAHLLLQATAAADQMFCPRSVRSRDGRQVERGRHHGEWTHTAVHVWSVICFEPREGPLPRQTSVAPIEAGVYHLCPHTQPRVL